MTEYRFTQREASERRTARPVCELTADETVSVVATLMRRADRVSLHEGSRIRRSLELVGTQLPTPTALARFLSKASDSAAFKATKAPMQSVPRVVRTRMVEHFTSQLEPIHIIVTGFPYKQHDNGLRAAGRRPDLAELAELLRIRALQNTFRSLYPPGLKVSILSDGGYYGDERKDAVQAYRTELRRLLELASVADFVTVRSLESQLRGAVGVDTWRRRGCLVRAVAHDIESAVEPARSTYSTRDAVDRLQRRGLTQPGLPSFNAVFRECLRSAPVPGGQTRNWVTNVLGAVLHLDVSEPIRSARVAVLETAWRDATHRLATAMVDYRLAICDQLPPHVQLPCLTSPTPSWQGTGYIDDGGRVAVRQYDALLDGGYMPITSRLLARGQPWVMVEPRLLPTIGPHRLTLLLSSLIVCATGPVGIGPDRVNTQHRPR